MGRQFRVSEAKQDAGVEKSPRHSVPVVSGVHLVARANGRCFWRLSQVAPCGSQKIWPGVSTGGFERRGVRLKKPPFIVCRSGGGGLFAAVWPFLLWWQRKRPDNQGRPAFSRVCKRNASLLVESIDPVRVRSLAETTGSSCGTPLDLRRARQEDTRGLLPASRGADVYPRLVSSVAKACTLPSWGNSCKMYMTPRRLASPYRTPTPAAPAHPPSSPRGSVRARVPPTRPGTRPPARARGPRTARGAGLRPARRG